MIRSRRIPTAFTLVELLVVVAIIALLLSILLPSMGRAREMAKTTKCLANLKELTNASFMYGTEDLHDILVPGPRKKTYDGWFWGAHHFGGKGGDKSLVLKSNWQHAWNAYGQFGPGDRPLNRILYKNPAWQSWQRSQDDGNPYTPDDERLEAHARLRLATFECPSDQGIPDKAGPLDTAWNDQGLGVLGIAGVPPNTSLYDVIGNSYVTHWTSPAI